VSGAPRYKFAILNASREEQAATRILLAITQALYDAKGTHQVNKTLLCKPLFKKRGNKLLNNIRPIALQNAVAKIPSKMLAARLTDDLHRLQALHPANEGFLKYRNTSNAINTVLNTWEDAKENNKACYCISFDISKAYDKLRWFTIEDGLTRLSIPDKFVHYALGKMQGSTFTIKTRYGLTPEFEIERSCPQGDPLSPLLFVIAMDLLQVGLHDNPLPKHAAHKKNGYAQQGSTEQIADKSYADDTLLLASSEAGLRRMNDWVNEFCNYNYISMNCEKTKLFGWNERGEDTTMTIQTTTQGPLGQTYNAVKAQPTAVHVKYLGIWMNMHLDWTKQVKKMNQMVGWHCHRIRKNNLTPETAAYIVNSHLKPKLEYRMKIIPKEYDVVKWDRSIHGAVNATINQRVTIKREALRRTLNIQFPSEYNAHARIVGLATTLNAQSSASTTTRLRITNPFQRARRIDPRDVLVRIKPRQHNRNQKITHEAETIHKLTMTDNTQKERGIFPKHLSPGTPTIAIGVKHMDSRNTTGAHGVTTCKR
jgi:hypothetical protein